MFSIKVKLSGRGAVGKKTEEAESLNKKVCEVKNWYENEINHKLKWSRARV